MTGVHVRRDKAALIQRVQAPARRPLQPEATGERSLVGEALSMSIVTIGLGPLPLIVEEQRLTVCSGMSFTWLSRRQAEGRWLRRSGFWMRRSQAWGLRNRWFADSSLEGSGFEPSVPLPRC